MPWAFNSYIENTIILFISYDWWPIVLLDITNLLDKKEVLTVFEHHKAILIDSHEAKTCYNPFNTLKRKIRLNLLVFSLKFAKELEEKYFKAALEKKIVETKPT